MHGNLPARSIEGNVILLNQHTDGTFLQKWNRAFQIRNRKRKQVGANAPGVIPLSLYFRNPGKRDFPFVL